MQLAVVMSGTIIALYLWLATAALFHSSVTRSCVADTRNASS